MPSPGILLLRESSAVALRPRAFLRRAAVLVPLALLIYIAWSVSAPSGGVYTSQSLGGLARALMGTFYVGITLVLLFAMPGATGGMIAGEREEGSLELLRMTPLGSYQIVAEKFLSRVAYAVKLLVLAGPLFCTPLFFGGVTFTEIATAILFPLSAAVWVAAVGLVCSALHRRAAPAVLWTYLAAVAWHVLGWGLLAFLGLDQDPAVGVHLLPLWSYLILPVVQGLNLHQPELLWMLPLETAAFAAGCVVLAGWLMGREERTTTGREASVQVRRRVWENPVAWKEVRATHTLAVRRLMSAVLALAGFSFFWALSKRWPLSKYGDAADIVYVVISIVVGGAGLIGAAWVRRRRFYWTAALIAVFLGLLLWGLAVILTPSPNQEIPSMITNKMVLSPLVLFLLFFMILGGAVAGATAVIHERVRKTYEALRMTPMPARAFIRGKVWGCWWTLMPSGIVILVASGMVLLMGEVGVLGMGMMLAVVFTTLYAVVRLGLFISARARRPAQAVLISLGALIGYLAILPIVAALILRSDAEVVLYINPFFWIGVTMQRSVVEHVPGCLCFCLGAVGMGLWLQALAASAFKSERWIERR